MSFVHVGHRVSTNLELVATKSHQGIPRPLLREVKISDPPEGGGIGSTKIEKVG